MSKPFRIGLAGLGTVGGGVAKLLHENAALIEKRCGRRLHITAASAKAQSEMAALPLGNCTWVPDAKQLAAADVDVVVELVGGHEGIARGLAEAALKSGKPLVTANKALLAHHGLHLATLAEQAGVTLAFEAAVAGGIPIIKALREGLAANRTLSVMGILNGTCNYILTRMREQKTAFEEVLSEAQKLGYAEANPATDVDGFDAAHKTAVLASLAFGIAPDIAQVHVQGIRHITLSDIEAAGRQGRRIRLLGVASMKNGAVVQRVQPCLVPESSPLFHVEGVMNGVVVEGDAVGRVFFEGRGAGSLPTASAVAADLMDIAAGKSYKPFILPAAELQVLPATGKAKTQNPPRLIPMEDI